MDLVLVFLTAILVVLNGFFVAAEFALVKMRPGRLNEIAGRDGLLSRTTHWLFARMDRSLSACQLGITMASLGLGWVGEPAIARLLEPWLHAVGVTSSAVLHTTAFTIAFSVITVLHLVIGEQAPKIFAIRRPEQMALWCALPLRAFYILTYPALVVLDSITSSLLRRLGVEGGAEHDELHSEEEIRRLLSHAHAHGELTKAEHRLIDAVFEFDEITCRQVMVPRREIAYVDVDDPIGEIIRKVRATKHGRYPVCRGSLDELVGVLHTRDLPGIPADSETGVESLMRPPRFVPDTLRIARLLRVFQATRQHMAFVLDEFGTVSGLVTLENVLEQIVGPVQDEFDHEEPDVVPDGAGRFRVQGGTLLQVVNRWTGLELQSDAADTLAGLLREKLLRVVDAGDIVEFDNATAEVLEVRKGRARLVRLSLPRDDAAAGA